VLEVVPITITEANELVNRWHRHHRPVQGGLFAVAVAAGDSIVGAAIIGRTQARMSDDGWTVEVTRCATDGTKNACSKLYRAAWRAASALGWKRLVTYTLPDEGGASLRAAGFRCLGLAGGGSWSRHNRPRVDMHPTQQKFKWELTTPRGDADGTATSAAT